MITKKVYLTFPKEGVTKPLICEMYEACRVRFNIRSASVNDHMGLVAMELSADTQQAIDKALEFFRSRGVTAEPIEMDVVAG